MIFQGFVENTDTLGAITWNGNLQLFNSYVVSDDMFFAQIVENRYAFFARDDFSGISGNCGCFIMVNIKKKLAVVQIITCVRFYTSLPQNISLEVVGGGKVERDWSFLKWKYAVVKTNSCVPNVLVCHRWFFKDL